MINTDDPLYAELRRLGVIAPDAEQAPAWGPDEHKAFVDRIEALNMAAHQHMQEATTASDAPPKGDGAGEGHGNPMNAAPDR